ncbi:MAG: hypothetical protein J6T24_02680, partial [Clostridia bacterium]|nr:hypothetical protein [Clostridia bacterium]
NLLLVMVSSPLQLVENLQIFYSYHYIIFFLVLQVGNNIIFLFYFPILLSFPARGHPIRAEYEKKDKKRHTFSYLYHFCLIFTILILDFRRFLFQKDVELKGRMW